MYFPGGETVTVLRRPDADRVGDRPGADVPHTVDGCGFNWQSTGEDTDRRETVQSVIEMYCPTGTDIKSDDKVRLADGRTFRVDGIEAPWHNPFTGWDAGTVVRLREVR